MDNLIKTFTYEDGTLAVDGRDLHDFLEVGKDFTSWFKDMINYGFEQGKDFTPFSVKSTGGRPRSGYALTLDMAKELSMIQRTEKGKQARQYFISMEKQSIKIPTTARELARLALQANEETNQRLDSVEGDVKNLKENQVIASPEYGALGRRVSQRVSEVAHSYGKITQHQRGELFKDINGGVKKIAGVSARSMLRKKDYQMVMDFINDWEPSTATKTIIRQTSLGLDE